MTKIAEGCGYPYAVRVDRVDALRRELNEAMARDALTFIEVWCAIGSRKDLGRPTITPQKNKQDLMAFLRERTAVKIESLTDNSRK